MSKLNGLLKLCRNTNSIRGSFLQKRTQTAVDSLPSHHFSQIRCFLDFYQFGNKEAIKKERARIIDEMNRGYFSDIQEFNKHGGKIGVANKTIVPAASAVKFPDVQMIYSDGKNLKLPFRFDGNVAAEGTSDFPKVTLICLSFRASSQAMINSWGMPFLEAFRDMKNVRLYEVSFIDSWFLRLSPIKKMLLCVMRKSNIDENAALQRKIVYSFDDHYYFRKELKILNLVTGYVFLLDKFGRVRWQGVGLATQEEVSSLLSCTSVLLEEE